MIDKIGGKVSSTALACSEGRPTKGKHRALGLTVVKQVSGKHGHECNLEHWVRYHWGWCQTNTREANYPEFTYLAWLRKNNYVVGKMRMLFNRTHGYASRLRLQFIQLY